METQAEYKIQKPTAVLNVLEAVENKSNCDYRIKCETDEFSAVCPRSGLPDLYSLSIEYWPDKSIVELKSLKLYLTSFRNVGIFVEDVANMIADQFAKAINPKFLLVRIIQHVRGGITTEVITSRGDSPENPTTKKTTKYETMD